MKVIYSNFLPVKGFRAINLFGVVFARKEEPGLDECILTHESVHTRQMERFSALWNICLERDAYDNDTDPLYLKQRRRYAFIKYL